MNGKSDSRHPLVGLSDELIRLNGRLKSLFAGARRDAGLGDSEMAVLNSVVEAERPPTVSQIGRSIGCPRQIIQRASDSLVAAGLIETAPNPDHKRAVLLCATPQGISVKRDLDARADALAEAIWPSADNDTAGVLAAAQALNAIRKSLELQLRQFDKGTD